MDRALLSAVRDGGRVWCEESALDNKATASYRAVLELTVREGVRWTDVAPVVLNTKIYREAKQYKAVKLRGRTKSVKE